MLKASDKCQRAPPEPIQHPARGETYVVTEQEQVEPGRERVRNDGHNRSRLLEPACEDLTGNHSLEREYKSARAKSQTSECEKAKATHPLIQVTLPRDGDQEQDRAEDEGGNDSAI